MSSNTTPGKQQDESVITKATRACKNAVTKCFGCVKESEEKTKIQYKLFQIENKKKAFGVSYINLVKENASDGALKACLDENMTAIAVLEEEVQELEDNIVKVQKETRDKIAAVPAASSTVNTTTAPTGAAVASEPTASSTAAAAAKLSEATTGTEKPKDETPKEDATSEIKVESTPVESTPSPETTVPHKQEPM